MKLDLREIIEIPGSSIPFECELETESLVFPQIREYRVPPIARGIVKNIAGALIAEGEIEAEMLQVCDRCLEEFEAKTIIPISVPLTNVPEDAESADLFLFFGDELELLELVESVFLFEMDAKSLCCEDCLGLCPDCGVNLNREECACDEKIDPRLAVLGQLLDTKDE
jgi:Predicted metal-binding, possibly nucleic acid-binding protein